jgi:Fe-S cluster assembly ATP-binding protein
MMLEIKDLKVSIEDKEILSGINLKVKAGEVHAIMGPNGSGKSTLASALAGRDYFDITQGKILYEGQDLTELSPEDRAREGIFLGFQYPVEIPGVSMVNFLRTALNSLREYRNQEPLPAGDFLKLMRGKEKSGGDRFGPDQPVGERRILRGRKKEERDLPDGAPGTQAGHPG